MEARVNGIRIAYTDQGMGDPVLLVHGFPMNRKMWTPQMETLSREYRLIAPDLRGHGDSDAPLWHFGLEDFADDLAGLLDHLGIQKAVMVGLSMGGYILFSFLRKYPDRLKGLILADTRATSDTPEIRQGRFLLAQEANRKGIDSVADAMLPKLLADSSFKKRPDLVAEVRRIIASNPSAGIIVDLIAMAERPDSTSVLSGIKCPTLVVVGEEDVATPPEEVRGMAALIPGSIFEVLPGAGHLSNFENPEAFNRICVTFLSDVSAGP